MQKMVFSQLILTLLVTILVVSLSKTTAQLSYTVFIVDKNGSNNATLCCEGIAHCSNLSQALNCASRLRISSNRSYVKVHIQAGNYSLAAGQYNFLGYDMVEIIGDGTNEVLITCEASAGIAFNHSKNIRISGLTLAGCGVSQLSTSTDFNQIESDKVLFFNVAVYIVFCQTVVIQDVNMSGSVGMAVALFNTNGSVEISNSVFENGRENDSQVPGGGGLYVEFFASCVSEWQPTCQGSTENYSSGACYNISNCIFTNNKASAGNIQTTRIQRDGHFAFGRGGGLSCYLRDMTSHIDISISHSSFHSNNAEIGGGMVALLIENNSDSAVKVFNTTFTDNTCTTQEVPPWLYSTGAGADIDLKTCYNCNNIVEVSNCTFAGNEAYWGGGFTAQTVIVRHGDGDLRNNEYVVKDCVFKENRARIGSAVELSCEHEGDGLCSATPQFRNCTFIGNKEVYSYSVSSTSDVHHKGRTFATFHSLNQLVEFHGNTTFENNSATGLGLQDCNAELMENSSMTFRNNTGKIGGGIALIGKSTFILSDGTNLNLLNNTAIENGGAVYAEQGQEQFAAYSHTCFITHREVETHPDLWNTNITLSGNKALKKQTGNSIYASSIFPCVYARKNTNKTEDIHATFCNWTSWHFHIEQGSNCSDEITTEPCTFQKQTYNLDLYPGIKATIPNFMVLDDLGHNVVNTTIFTTCAINTQTGTSSLQAPLVTSSGIWAYGNVGSSGTFELQTADRRSVYAKLDIRLHHCPPGFNLSNNNACECSKGSFKGAVQCMQSKAYIIIGFCIAYDNSTREVISTRCPFFTADLADSPVQLLSQNVSKLDGLCKKVCRQGNLCKECTNGHCINIFNPTYKCIKFKNEIKRWFEAFAVTLLPLTIFFTVAVVFHVSMTSASTNGYLFFSHVMTNQIQVLVISSGWSLVLQQQHFGNMTKIHQPQEVLSNFILAPYSIWNLDFFRIFNIEVCLRASLHIMHVLALHYVIALYPILLIIVTYIIIELHARNCRLIVWLWRPLCFLCVRFRRNWELRTSVIDAFATFTLLSYSKIIGVSFLLLTPSPVILANGTKLRTTLNFDPSVEFFKHDHWPYGACAIIMLLLCAIIPVLLILHPFQWFQRLLNVLRLNRPGLQIFVCAFQGCFKDGTNGDPDRRYFAGIYFLMRIVVYLTYTLADDLVIMYSCLLVIHVLFLLLLLILQPYKNHYYNYLDGFFIAILAITSSSSVYLLYFLYGTSHISVPVWYLTMALMIIPTIYVVGHLTTWICLRSRWCKQCFQRLRQGPSNADDYQDPYEEDDYASTTSTSSTRLLRSMSDSPDRVENPQRYNQQSGDRDSGLSPSWAASPTIADGSASQQTEYGAATY